MPAIIEHWKGKRKVLIAVRDNDTNARVREAVDRALK